MSASTQAKLLRVIQEREVRRLGGKETIKLDVRIIAATNKDLEEEIKKGNFREDLYYRFNVIAFTVPPLRERITDVPILVEHFLKKLNDSNGREKSIEDDALQALMRYDWPGNVRQLESIMERAYIMGEEDTIDLAHLPREVQQAKAVKCIDGIDIPDEGLDLDEMEKELIRKAIIKADGKISLAAKYLNMSYDKLWFKVRKMKEKDEILGLTTK